MAVLVARRRTDVVGGDDAPQAITEPAQDQHDPEPRQLVVVGPDRAGGGAHRRLPRASRRGSWPPGRSRCSPPGSRCGPRRPRCTRAGGRTARGRAGRCRRDGSVAGRRRGRRPGPVPPSSVACGSQSKRLVAPCSSTSRARPAAGSRGARSSSVVLPAPPAAAATMTGTRPSISSHSFAASSASSVPARISSTMERGVGGTWRTAHRPRAGEASAKGISERSMVARSRGGQRTAALRGASNAPLRDRRQSGARQPATTVTIGLPSGHGTRHPAAHARPHPRPRDPVRPGRRPEVVLVRLVPGPWAGLDQRDGRREPQGPRRRRRRNRTTRRDSSRTRTTRSSAG